MVVFSENRENSDQGLCLCVARILWGNERETGKIIKFYNDLIEKKMERVAGLSP